jgi:hypothetical protein
MKKEFKTAIIIVTAKGVVATLKTEVEGLFSLIILNEALRKFEGSFNSAIVVSKENIVNINLHFIFNEKKFKEVVIPLSKIPFTEKGVQIIKMKKGQSLKVVIPRKKEGKFLEFVSKN